MSSFAGVSVVTGGKHCTTSAINAAGDIGYHLLVVNDYSRTVRETPNGEGISSGPFTIGGHRWIMEYCPNGYGPSCADFVSFYICLCDDDDSDMEVVLEAKFEFSYVDQVEYQKPMRIRAGETFRFSSKGPSRGVPQFIRRDVLERSAHLKEGDCFTIRCDIMVCNTGGTLSDDIHQHLDSLLTNKVASDVTFEVGGETFCAHRCVLAARSKVFMAQLFGPMTEGTTPAVIQIKGMEPKVFAALLSFIYTDSFPKMHKDNNMEEEGEGQDEEEGQEEQEGQDEDGGQEEDEGQEEEEGKEEEVMWLQDLLVAADRYDLQQLKFSCENELSEHLDVRSVASILSLAEQHHCHRLKDVCFKFIQVQSPKCLAEVMATDGWALMITTYPSVLNELVAKLVSNQKKGNKRKC